MPTVCEKATATVTACPLCGATDTSFQHETDDREFRRCSTCDFLFAIATGTGAESDEAYYDRLGGYEQFIPAKSKQWDLLFRDLAKRTEGRRLLEIGCTRGYALAQARMMGWLPHGIEISSEDAEFARERFGLYVHNGRIETCPFEPASFDVITMWSVIEHIDDPISALGESQRLLKPGGLLSIHTCNADSQIAREQGWDWSMFKAHGHVSLFGLKTLGQALLASGFEIVDFKTAIGTRPVNIGPSGKPKASVRSLAGKAAGSLGIKEPLRHALYKLKPELRDRGEFMEVIARRR